MKRVGNIVQLRTDFSPNSRCGGIELYRVLQFFQLVGIVQRVLQIRIRLLGLLEMFVESLGRLRKIIGEFLGVLFLTGLADAAL